MKSLRNLTAIVLTAVLAFVISGCSSDGGDDPVLPLPPAHVHAYSDSWTSNETHHWHAATCGHTDQVKDKAEHDFPETWIEVTAATEEDDGLEERFCSVCEYRETRIIIMLGHNHNVDRNNWTSDETHHWHVADCGRPAHNEDFAPHTEDSGTVTTAPTCTEKGLRTYKCTVCDKALRIEEIPATGHIEDNGTVTTAPTCVTKGIKTYKCTVCGEVLRKEEIPATGHTEDSGTVTTRVTLTSDGVKIYKCTVCGAEVRTETLAKPKLYETPIDAETGKSATKSSKYIYFGVFPRTVLASGSTVTVDETASVTMGANTYYRGSDGNYYAKVKENCCDSINYTYTDGTDVKQSGKNSYRYFKVEPIKWKVLTDSYNGKSLLFAEDILTASVPYYKSSSVRTIGGKTVYVNNYRYSTIRAYLNGKYESDDTQSTDYKNKGFLQTAFTGTAQAMIADTEVDNSKETTGFSERTYATEYACENTTDKIFLLSLRESFNSTYGFPAYDEYGLRNARIREATDYAKANNAFQNSNTGYYGGIWWLRSPSCYGSDDARVVFHDGEEYYCERVDGTKYGVVPALSISLP